MILLRPNKQIDQLLNDFPVRVIRAYNALWLIRPQSEVSMPYSHVIYFTEQSKRYVITELNDRAQYAFTNIF
jgi:hypothetical protein